MRRSITAKILMTIAAVLLVTDLGLLGLGLSTVYRTVRQTYASYAKAAAAARRSLIWVTTLKKSAPVRSILLTNAIRGTLYLLA